MKKNKLCQMIKKIFKKAKKYFKKVLTNDEKGIIIEVTNNKIRRF